jgi:hypothetical protein
MNNHKLAKIYYLPMSVIAWLKAEADRQSEPGRKVYPANIITQLVQSKIQEINK